MRRLFNSKYFPGIFLGSVVVLCVLFGLITSSPESPATSGWLGNLGSGVVSSILTIFVAVWTVELTLAHERKKEKILQRRNRLKYIQSASENQYFYFKKWFDAINPKGIEREAICYAKDAASIFTILLNKSVQIKDLS
jgi:hypothetical protein